MVRVSPYLVREKVRGRPVLEELLGLLEDDWEVQDFLEMCNDMVVKRLYYNDHGPVHSRVVAGSALEILDLLLSHGVVPTSVRDSGLSLDDARAVVLLGAYLHDIGNMVHRGYHHIIGAFLANDILKRVLPRVFNDRRRLNKVRQEVLHCVVAHDDSMQALSVEAGVVKLADGTDMAEGRARIPYREGKSDIHAISALAIKYVELVKGVERPVNVLVEMENEAGVFQVEEVYGRKILTSGLARYVEVAMMKNGVLFKTYAPDYFGWSSS